MSRPRSDAPRIRGRALLFGSVGAVAGALLGFVSAWFIVAALVCRGDERGVAAAESCGMGTVFASSLGLMGGAVVGAIAGAVLGRRGSVRGGVALEGRTVAHRATLTAWIATCAGLTILLFAVGVPGMSAWGGLVLFATGAGLRSVEGPPSAWGTIGGSAGFLVPWPERLVGLGACMVLVAGIACAARPSWRWTTTVLAGGAVALGIGLAWALLDLRDVPAALTSHLLAGFWIGVGGLGCAVLALAVDRRERPQRGEAAPGPQREPS